MDELENIKLIWKTEKANALPNSEVVKSLIKKYQSAKKRNLFLLIALALACLIIFIWTIAFQTPSPWTTILGEVLIFLGLIITLSLKILSLKNATKNEQKTNRQFLEDLKKSTGNQSQIKLIQRAGVLMLSVGFGFYIYKIVSNDLTKLVLTYAGIVLYVIFIYFVFRPLVMKKTEQRINRLLEKIDNSEEK
ncbi:MAG: hypothetical protein R2739_09090 [Chitinophagales bacterium]